MCRPVSVARLHGFLPVRGLPLASERSAASYPESGHELQTSRWLARQNFLLTIYVGHKEKYRDV